MARAIQELEALYRRIDKLERQLDLSDARLAFVREACRKHSIFGFVGVKHIIRVLDMSDKALHLRCAMHVIKNKALNTSQDTATDKDK